MGSVGVIVHVSSRVQYIIIVNCCYYKEELYLFIEICFFLNYVFSGLDI